MVGGIGADPDGGFGDGCCGNYVVSEATESSQFIVLVQSCWRSLRSTLVSLPSIASGLA